MKIKSSYIYIVMSQLSKPKPKDDNLFGPLAEDTDTSSTDPDMPPLLENYAKDDDTTPDESEYHQAREGEEDLTEDAILLPPNLDDILYKTLLDGKNPDADSVEIIIASAVAYINSIKLYLQCLFIQLHSLIQLQTYIELSTENGTISFKDAIFTKVNSQIIDLGKKIAYYSNIQKYVEDLFDFLSSPQNGGQYTEEELSKFNTDEFVAKPPLNPEEYQSKCVEIFEKYLANEKAFNELKIFEYALDANYSTTSSFKDVSEETLPENVVLSKKMDHECSVLRRQNIEISKITERTDITLEEKSRIITELLETKEGGMMRRLATAAAVAAAALSSPAGVSGLSKEGSLGTGTPRTLGSSSLSFSPPSSRKIGVEETHQGTGLGVGEANSDANNDLVPGSQSEQQPNYSKIGTQIINSLTPEQQQLFLQQQEDLKFQIDAFVSTLEAKELGQGNFDIDNSIAGPDLRHVDTEFTSVWVKKLANGEDGALLSDERLICFDYKLDENFELYSQHPDKPISLYELKSEEGIYELIPVIKNVRNSAYKKTDTDKLTEDQVNEIAEAIGNEQQRITSEFNTFYKSNKGNLDKVYKFWADEIFNNPLFSYSRRFELIAYLYGSTETSFDEPLFKKHFGNKVSPSKVFGIVKEAVTGKSIFIKDAKQRKELIASTELSDMVYTSSPLGQMASDIARVRNIEFTGLNGAKGTVQYDITTIVLDEALDLLENMLLNIPNDPEDPKWSVYGRWLIGIDQEDVIGRAVAKMLPGTLQLAPKKTTPSDSAKESKSSAEDSQTSETQGSESQQEKEKIIPQRGKIQELRLALTKKYHEKNVQDTPDVGVGPTVVPPPPKKGDIPLDIIDNAFDVLKLNTAHIFELKRKEFTLVKSAFDGGMTNVRDIVTGMKTVVLQTMRQLVSKGEFVREDTASSYQAVDSILSKWSGISFVSSPVLSTVTLDINPKIEDAYRNHIISLNQGYNSLLLDSNPQPLQVAAPPGISFQVRQGTSKSEPKSKQLKVASVSEGSVEMLEPSQVKQMAIDNLDKKIEKLLGYLPIFGGGVTMDEETGSYFINYQLQNVYTSGIDEELLKLLNNQIEFQSDQELIIINTLWPEAIVGDKKNKNKLLEQSLEADYKKYRGTKAGVESEKMPQEYKDQIIASAVRWATLKKMKLITMQLRTVFDKTDQLVVFDNTQHSNRYALKDFNGNPISFYGQTVQTMTEDTVRTAVFNCNSTIAVLRRLGETVTNDSLTIEEISKMMADEESKQQKDRDDKFDKEKLAEEKELKEKLDKDTASKFDLFQSQFQNWVANGIMTLGDFNLMGYNVGAPIAFAMGLLAYLGSLSYNNGNALLQYILSSTNCVFFVILLITLSSEAYNTLNKPLTNSILSYFSLSGNIISGIRILAPAIVAAAMNKGLLARNYPPEIVSVTQLGGTAVYLFWGPIKVRIEGWIKGSPTAAGPQPLAIASVPQPVAIASGPASPERRGGDLTTPARRFLLNGTQNPAALASSGAPSGASSGASSGAPSGGYIKHKVSKSSNKNRKANKTKKPRRTLHKNKKSKHNSSQKKNKNKKTKTKKHKYTIRHK